MPEYRINLRAVNRPLAAGELVSLAPDNTTGSNRGKTGVGRVISADGDTAIIDVAGIGQVEAIRPGRYETRLDLKGVTELALLCASPIETDNPEILRAFMDRLAARYPAKPGVFFVESVRPEGAFGTFYCEGPRPVWLHSSDGDMDADAEQEDGEAAEDREFVGRFRYRHNIAKPLFGAAAPEAPPEAVEGDLLAVGDIRFEVVEGFEIALLGDAALVGNLKDRDAVLSFLKTADKADRNGYAAVKHISHETLERELGIAHARTEPDEALVVVYGDGPYPGTHVLASTGYVAATCDDLSDQLGHEGCGEGLWVCENLAYWSHTSYEGEHDGGVNTDWRPATVEDVERLFGSVEALDAELRDATDCYPDEAADRLTAYYTGLAEKEVFEEAFAAEHRKFAAYRFGVEGEHEYWYARDFIVNGEDMAAYVAARTVSLPADLAADVSKILTTHIRKTHRVFAAVEPTEAEAASFAARVYPGKNAVYHAFVPDEKLDEDIVAVVSAVRRGAEQIRMQTGRGFRLANVDVYRLMAMVRTPADVVGLPLFSQARRTGGEWKLLSHDQRTKTELALVVENRHVATLRIDGEGLTLFDPFGLHMVPFGREHDRTVYRGSSEIALDADRAYCEVEARRLFKGDLLSPAPDGDHELSEGEGQLLRVRRVAIADGVLHAEGRPAMVEDGYEEWRFRGNLHRDDGPAYGDGEEDHTWCRHGLEHRSDGPSTVFDEHVEYQQFGRPHRTDGPSKSTALVEMWHTEGRLHRTDGPAVTWYGQSEEYYRMGLRHRTDGPAVTSEGQPDRWMLNGHEKRPRDVMPMDGVDDLPQVARPPFRP